MDVNGENITKESDFVTGFIKNGSVLGRPVDITFDQSGKIYISDDANGNIYLVY